MKQVKKIILTSILLSSLLTLFGCQDVIYDNIRKEVTLEDGTVSGSVRSIIRYKNDGTNYFYLSNGASIYRKNIDVKQSYGNWEKVYSVGSSKYIIQIASDETYLYELVGEWEENTKKGQNRWSGRAIYCSEDGGKTWTEVEDITLHTSPTDTTTGTDPVILFCTNSIDPSNRHAYLNYKLNDKFNVLKLDGTNTSAISLIDSKDNASTSPTELSSSCAALDSNVYFFNRINRSSSYTSASCTNETNEEQGDTIYYSSGATLYWKKADGNAYSKSAGGYIYSLATTKDYLLVGTDSGIEHYKLDADGNVGAEEDFPTNAAAIMTSSYEVNALAVVDPSKNENESVIYSSIDFADRNQQFDHICLWAYYPERGNWNRD